MRMLSPGPPRGWGSSSATECKGTERPVPQSPPLAARAEPRGVFGRAMTSSVTGGSLCPAVELVRGFVPTPGVAPPPG